VGAGTGTTCFGFKAGVGNSSRRAEDGTTLGCLVVSNYGARRDRELLAGPGAEQAEPAEGGSIVIVLATDAALSERQLRRLAARSSFGLGRAGSFAANSSGEYAFAFSTAHAVPHRSEASHQEFRFLRDDSAELRRLFEMAGEVTQEAIFGSMCSAATMEGRDGHRAEALPYELLEELPGVRR
jgi:D-aminopeptidase